MIHGKHRNFPKKKSVKTSVRTDTLFFLFVNSQGDSGGPVIQYDEAGNPVLVAVVSFGVGCARPQFPGVNTRVAFYRDWFERIGMDFIASTSVAPKYV